MKYWLLVVFCLLSFSCNPKGLFDTSVKAADARPESYMPMLKEKRVALIINQTSKVGGVSLLDILLERQVNVVKIFVPEHGFRGTEDAGATIENATDSATHIPVISLYGSNKKPNNKVLVIDLVRQELALVIALGEFLAPHGMVATVDGMLWVVCDISNKLLLIDPAKGEIVAAYDCPAKGPHLVARTPDENGGDMSLGHGCLIPATSAELLRGSSRLTRLDGQLALEPARRGIVAPPT